MQQFLKKSKPYWIAAAAAVACLCCFFIVWFYYLRGCETKAQSIYLNDTYNTQTAALENGVATTQEFTTESAVYGIGIIFERLDPDVAGIVYITLTDVQSGETVLRADGNIAEVIYNSYTGFLLNKPVTEAAPHTWLLSVTPDYTQCENELALAKNGSTLDGFGMLKENDIPAVGTLALLATVEQLGSLPVKGFWVLALVCAALAAGLALLCQFKHPGKAVLTFLTVLALGLCYQFVLPAYSAPDEALHYHTAYAISNAWMGVKVSDPETNNFTQRQCDADAVFSDFNTTPYTYRYMMQHFFDGAPAQNRYVESHVDLMGGYKLPYVLSAVGITLARLLRFGGIATAFFGRLWNLVFFAAMAALAVHFAPVKKGLFAAFALLPASLHMGGSYSYDSCLLALSMVFIALCLCCAMQESAVSKKQIAALCVLCFLLAPLKSIYLPLCLLVFLIPAARYSGRGGCLAARLGALGAAGASYVAYSWLTIYQMLLFSFRFATQPGADRVAALAAPTLFLPSLFAGAGRLTGTFAAAIAAATGATSTYSLFYLVVHPGILLKLLCNTFFPNATDYAAGLLGGKLGYLNLAEVDINGLILIGFAALLLLGCLMKKGDNFLRLSGGQRALLALVFFLVLGMLGVVCIYWTPSDYTYLWGFQGRYLLPLLPCLLLILPFRRIHAEGDLFHGILYGGFALEILTLLNILAVIFQR
jgi:uncharacterized membrane protein